MIFRCTLRTDLPVDVSMEFILRIAPEIGVGSQWTREALSAAISIREGLRIHLSDDVSMGLFHLAELLTRSIMQDRDATDAPDAAYAFCLIIILLSRGSGLRHRLIPAVSVLGLRWLRDKPFDDYGNVVEGITSHIIAYYNTIGRERLRRCPGITPAAEFCRRFRELWPDYSRSMMIGTRSQRTFDELVAISLEFGGAGASAWPPATDPDTATVPCQAGGGRLGQGRALCNTLTDAARAVPVTDSNSFASTADRSSTSEV